MTETINIIGLAANDPVPGVYTQVLFAQGASSQSNTVYSAVILANISSSGTAGVDGYLYGPDTVVPMQSVADAISLFGQGSEAHRMVKQFMKVNPTTPLYVAPVKASTGSAATSNIIVSASSITNPGTLRTYVGADFVDTGFTTSDTASTIATAMITNINANQDLPVTASSGGAGVVTLTAKVAGLRGNWLRSSSVVLGSLATGVSTSQPIQAFFTGGTIADSSTNVLSYLNGLNQRFYYQISAAEDATQFGALATQINSQASPIPGLRQRCFAGSSDTLANVTTIATGINSARAEIVWLAQSDVPPSELASLACAAYALIETPPITANELNFDYFGNDSVSASYWFVKAPLSGVAPSRANIKSALLNGISPIQVFPHGRTALVSRITTRSLNGAVNDYRIRDAHKVTVSDFFADDVSTACSNQFARKAIANDPTQPNQPPPGPGVVQPQQVKQLIIQYLGQYNNNGVLQSLPITLSSMLVQREASPSTRITARIPLYPADVLHQIGLSVEQN